MHAKANNYLSKRENRLTATAALSRPVNARPAPKVAAGPLRTALILATFVLLVITGCHSDDGGSNPDKPPIGTFESYWPGSGNGGNGMRASQEETLDGAGSAPTAAQDDTSNGLAKGDEAGRAISEADIIQVQGDRLYALSRYGGLSVVDVSQRDRLELLGRYQGLYQAEPFEMYLRDGVAMVMFSSWGEYAETEDETGWVWVQTSKLLALDVRDPADIVLLGSFDIPGSISDSRIVGDVLYLVGYRDGYCWRCEQNQPLTAVVSLDISNPTAIQKVDELRYLDNENTWGGSRRSITVTSERMYVAGVEYGQNGPVGSGIQVVDISDPKGKLVEGATVQAEGQISSRWQMDETDGVLRVVSQPPDWNIDAPPVVQTFTVVSAQQIEPLGRTPLVLPRSEQLQSVRFDGPRAYAITFEQTDPLFTIDLSDPANPRQAGELEMPGWLYHMEPRGDRLVGLGYDQRSAQGAITVSIFDVSDLSQPSMLSRVNFGGDWANLPEDQDRIHKAFRVLDELGLILVPYSGYSYDESGFCGRSQNGVQLIDFEDDSLTLRGAVSMRGEARRAFIHDTRLFAVSDARVDSFNIEDRSAPERTFSLALTRNIDRMLPLANGKVARLSTDWWSDDVTIDIVSQADVNLPQSSSSELHLGEDASDDGSDCKGYTWILDAFTKDNQLLVLYNSEQYTESNHDYSFAVGLLIVDASDSENPAVISDTTWPVDDNWWISDGWYSYGLPSNGRSVVLAGDALAMIESTWVEVRINPNEYDGYIQYRMRILDISDPQEPTSTLLDLPKVEGYGALLASGNMVVTSHYEPIADKPDAVRFFLDRFDVSDPATPSKLQPINVPGAVIDYNHDNSRAVVSELRLVETVETTWEDCADRFANFDFEYDYHATNSSTGTSMGGSAGGDIDTASETDSGANVGGSESNVTEIIPEPALGTCTGYIQVLNLVDVQDKGAALLDRYEIAENQQVNTWSMGDDVLFAVLSRGGYYGRGIMVAMDCIGPCGYYGYEASEPSDLLVLGGLAAGKFQSGQLQIDDADNWWGWWGSPPVHAAGTKALFLGRSDVSIVDASNPKEPLVERTEPLNGNVENVSMTETAALLSLGVYGAQVVELSP